MPQEFPSHPDVLVIGAGPAGATAASLLAQAGLQVLVVEKSSFPRFVIGESLLPQAMEFLEASGVLPTLQEAGFQPKHGALFARGTQRSFFSFHDSFTPGWGETFQVQRGRFDQILAQHAEKSGATLLFHQEIIAYTPQETGPIVELRSCVHAETSTSSSQPSPGSQSSTIITPRFVLDASGFGQVLPRLLGLQRPSHFPTRTSVFAHIDDHRRTPDTHPELISISIHPTHKDIWYWLIPFANQTASVGVVAPPERLEELPDDPAALLRALLDQEPLLAARTAGIPWVMPPKQVTAYASEVSQTIGPHFALLGNAGGFLDPIFSSGVTIALKSAHLAAQLLIAQHKGQSINWQNEFVIPLRQGVETFQTFVEAWYDGSLQAIIFSEKKPSRIKQMICSVLAGYAWDTNNPYVAQHRRRLAALGEICQQRLEEHQSTTPA